MRKWNICLLITIILFVFSSSAVNAADIDSTDVSGDFSNDFNSMDLSSEAVDDYYAADFDANDSYSKYSDGDIIKENDNSVVSVSGSFTKLFFAVNQVDNGGTVNLTGGILLASSEDAFTNGIVINKNITIDGNGFIITAHSSSNKPTSVFNIQENCSLVLKNLLIVGAHSAIVNNFGDLNITNVNFISCTGVGSCVNQNGGNLFMNGSVITDCSAPAIYLANKSVAVLDNVSFANNQRSIYNDKDCVLTVLNSLFIENTLGGTISNAGNLTVVNSIFNSNDGVQVSPIPGIKSNTNMVYGGLVSGSAIYNKEGSVTVIDSSFRSNHANGGGGAISTINGSMNIIRSNFTKNVVYQDHVAGAGSAIDSYGTDFNIVNSSFSENRRSAALYLNGGGNVNIDGSLFYHNAGDGIFAGWTTDGNLNIKNTRFIKNTVMAISNQQFSYSISDSYFEGNNEYNDNFYYNSAAIQDYSGHSNSISGSTFVNNGRAIFSSNNDLTVSNSTFTGNSHVDGGAIYNQLGHLTVVDSVFDDNIASKNGGAIYNVHNGTLDIVNSNFSDNSAKESGDAVHNVDGESYDNGLFGLDGIWKAVSSVIEEIINTTTDEEINSSSDVNPPVDSEVNSSSEDVNSSSEINSSVVDNEVNNAESNSTDDNDVNTDSDTTSSNNDNGFLDDIIQEVIDSVSNDDSASNSSDISSDFGESPKVSSDDVSVEDSRSSEVSPSQAVSSSAAGESQSSSSGDSAAKKSYEITKDTASYSSFVSLPFFILIIGVILLLCVGYYRNKKDDM